MSDAPGLGTLLANPNVLAFVVGNGASKSYQLPTRGDGYAVFDVAATQAVRIATDQGWTSEDLARGTLYIPYTGGKGLTLTLTFANRSATASPAIVTLAAVGVS